MSPTLVHLAPCPKIITLMLLIIIFMSSTREMLLMHYRPYSYPNLPWAEMSSFTPYQDDF